MNKILATILASTAILLAAGNLYADPSFNKLQEPTYIIRVNSKQPQTIVGSYLALTRTGSSLVEIHQKTPLEIKVTAQTVNAIFRTAASNTFLKVQLLRQENNKTKILVEQKGHAIIVNTHSSCQQAFIIAR